MLELFILLRTTVGCVLFSVPKKGGMSVVPNEMNELVPMSQVTGWRVCIAYRKLNAWTENDHFPMPFMDQMLDRLAGKFGVAFLMSIRATIRSVLL